MFIISYFELVATSRHNFEDSRIFFMHVGEQYQKYGIRSVRMAFCSQHWNHRKESERELWPAPDLFEEDQCGSTKQAITSTSYFEGCFSSNGFSVGTIWNVLKRDEIRRASNTLKPLMAETNKIQRFSWALKFFFLTCSTILNWIKSGSVYRKRRAYST